MLKSAIRPHGFTLMELMITIVVLAIIMTIAIPHLSDWIAKARVRTAVENLQNGLRRAQEEATQRNEPVEFVLVAARPPVADRQGFNNDKPIDNGTSWVIRVVPSVGKDAKQRVFLEGGTLTDSGGVLVTGGNSGSNAQVVFGGIGQVFTESPIGKTVVPYLTTSRAYVISTSDKRFPMCVFVRSGGGVRWCDLSRPATDTQGCPTVSLCRASPKEE